MNRVKVQVLVDLQLKLIRFASDLDLPLVQISRAVLCSILGTASRRSSILFSKCDTRVRTIFVNCRITTFKTTTKNCKDYVSPLSKCEYITVKEPYILPCTAHQGHMKRINKLQMLHHSIFGNCTFDSQHQKVTTDILLVLTFGVGRQSWNDINEKAFQGCAQFSFS